MKSNLLCVFTSPTELQEVLDTILETYELETSRIFIFSNAENTRQYYCTFNVVGEYQLAKSTISVHRKSESSTLYTINALNEIIKNLNNGILDKGYELDWENFRNMLLIVRGGEIHRIPLKLERVVRI